MAFITVYSKTTGRRQQIPAHWLSNPVLSRDFQAPPPAEVGAGKSSTARKPRAPRKTAAARKTSKSTRGSAAGSAHSTANTKEKK